MKEGIEIIKGKKDIRRIKDNHYHYEFIKEYPHFLMYRCLENGCIECFKKEELTQNYNPDIKYIGKEVKNG